MKIEYRLKNGERHGFTIPADEVHRAIMWMPRSSDDKKNELPNFIILPDYVRRVAVTDED